MSNNLSEEAVGSPKDPSVYDFVYVDRERIASTLSQFDDNGSLVKLTRSDGLKGSKGGEAGVSGFVKGNIGEETTQSLGQEYDPSWLAPLNFLDVLSSENMLLTDLDAARIGQLVLVSGALSIADLTIFSGMWENPVLRKTLIAAAIEQPEGNRRDRRSSQQSSKQPPNPAEVAISILGMMPHYLQATIGSDPAIWCNLEPEKMQMAVGDFAMKHGTYIPGKWHAVGILDARPENDFEEYAQPPQNVLAAALGEMWGPVRFLLGGRLGCTA